MIRKFIPADLQPILKIWLDSNLQVHSFIPKSYWESHLSYMAQVLPQAEIYVYEIEEEVVAFVGLEKNYIAGIFTHQMHRSKGIGKQLVNFLKKSHSCLYLNVYEKNQSAIKFYLREQFKIIEKSFDTDQSEKELLMRWNL